MRLEVRWAAIYLLHGNCHPIHALKYKRHPHSLLTNRTPSATEKNLLLCIFQPVLHVAGASRIMKSKFRGEFQRIWEPFIVGPGVVVVKVFVIVGLISHHPYPCSCDDELVNSEISWHATFFFVYSLLACDLLDHGEIMYSPFPVRCPHGGGPLQAPLCPPPRPVPKDVTRTKEITKEMTKRNRQMNSPSPLLRTP